MTHSLQSRTFTASPHAARSRLVALVLEVLVVATTTTAMGLALATPAETAEPTRLVLRVDGAIAGVDQEKLRTAISAELGVEVAFTTATTNGIGTITVRVVPGAVVVGFHAPSGDQVARQIVTPKASIAVETIVLIVGNLVRDEASDLIAQLKFKATASVGGVTVAASASVDVGGAPATSASASAASPAIAVAPPPMTVTSVAAPSILRVAAPIVPRFVGPCETPRVGPWWGIDFVPRLGSSLTEDGAQAVRVASFGAIGSYSAGLQGFELAGVLAIKTRGMCGAQIAGVANVVSGPVHGMQLAGVLNYARGDLAGVQLGMVDLALGAVVGAQLGVVTVAHGSVTGAQLGVVNVATGAVHGAQLGVVNYADTSDVSIGLVSIQRHGHTTLDVWSTEGLHTSVGIEHGGRYFHNVFAAGVRPGRDKLGWSLTYGLGARFLDRPAFTLDLDALHAWYQGGGLSAWSLTSVSQLRLALAVRLGGDISLVAGPTFSVMVTDDEDEARRKHVGGDILHEPRTTQGDHNLFVVGWPGVTLGLRGDL